MYERAIWCGPNDGGIKRGDRAETGDEQARATGDDSLAGFDDESLDDEGLLASDEPLPEDDLTLDNQPMSRGDLEDLTILDAGDPALGLTNIGNKPAEDWAADTGPTRSNEEMDEETTPD